MRDYFSKKYERGKLNFQNFRSKAVIRLSNLAKRLDQSHSKHEAKKKGK